MKTVTVLAMVLLALVGCASAADAPEVSRRAEAVPGDVAPPEPAATVAPVHPTEDRSSVEMPPSPPACTAANVPLGASCAPNLDGAACGVEGASYSCAGAAPTRPPAEAGWCLHAGSHEAFGLTWHDLICERPSCTRLSTQDRGGAWPRCGEERPDAYACPLRRSDRPSGDCVEQGASWADGIGYGPIWCCAPAVTADAGPRSM